MKRLIALALMGNGHWPLQMKFMLRRPNRWLNTTIYATDPDVASTA